MADLMTGEAFERAIREDTVRRVLAILRDNLMLHHPRGLLVDGGTGEALRDLRERLHPGKEPARG